MKQIRRSVFETNSSSTHSISIKKNNAIEENMMQIDDDGYIHAALGEFGWEIENYYSQCDRLSYLLTMAAHKNGFYIWCSRDGELTNEIAEFVETDDFKRISDAVGEHARCNGVVLDLSEGYIDHQSHEDYRTLDDFLNEYGTNITEFIFGDSVVIHTDNDNY